MRLRRALGLKTAVTSLSAVMMSLAAVAGSFGELEGAWRGSGQVKLTGGQTEQLTCKAYYTTKDSGVALGLALSCASPSNKIDLRANLVRNGETVSGTWEERAFNSSGAITGKIAGERIDLTVSGTLQATMAIELVSGTQSVSIATDGTGFQSVSLKLSRL